MKFEIDVLQWSDDHSTGLGKMYFSREDSCISHYLLCISLLENIQNFPLNGHISLEGGS